MPVISQWMSAPDLVDLTESPDAPLPSPTNAGARPYVFASSSESPTSRPRKRQRVGDRESPIHLGTSSQIQADEDIATFGTPAATSNPSITSKIESNLEQQQANEASSSAGVSSSQVPLGQYTCPVCFSPPRSATLTVCGHILCASCLFGAVRSARDRATSTSDANTARCPVCRAVLRGWDWKGGGIVAIEAKVLRS